MAPARTRAAVSAASATSPEAVAVGEWDAERASTAATHVMDFLNQLADDELLRVLSHLGVTDLCRLAQVCKHCMELATCDLSWELHVQELCRAARSIVTHSRGTSCIATPRVCPSTTARRSACHTSRR